MPEQHQVIVTPDELRRAFAIVQLIPADADHMPDINGESDGAVFAALERHFSAAMADALLGRVLLVMLWLETDDADDLVEYGTSPLGIPEIHPAVFDVAASYPMPARGIPSPGPFLRALASGSNPMMLYRFR